LLGLVGYFTYTLDPNTPATMQASSGSCDRVRVLLPALTMRLWADGEEARTIELLMTFPVTVPQMILGKFSPRSPTSASCSR